MSALRAEYPPPRHSGNRKNSVPAATTPSTAAEATLRTSVEKSPLGSPEPSAIATAPPASPTPRKGVDMASHTGLPQSAGETSAANERTDERLNPTPNHA